MFPRNLSFKKYKKRSLATFGAISDTLFSAGLIQKIVIVEIVVLEIVVHIALDFIHMVNYPE